MPDYESGGWFSRRGWISHKYDIAAVQAEYGLQAARDVSNIEAAANRNIALIQADAAKDGYKLSYESALAAARAQELTALFNKQGVENSAHRYALAQEYSARMNLEGTEIQALAQKFTATEQANAQKYTADKSVDSSRLYSDAQRFTASEQRAMNQYIADVEARAAVVNTERASKAEEYKARMALKETQRASQAQEYSSKASMHGQVASSGIQGTSNVVSSGFGAFNYGQRSFYQWAMGGTNDPRTLAQRIMITSMLFIGGMFVLFVAMDMFGIPILATLANLVAESGARAVAYVEAVRNGSSNAGEIFSGYGTTLAASIGGMTSALWDRLNDFFDWVMESITDLMANISKSF
jgi:hypothetical protein